MFSLSKLKTVFILIFSGAHAACLSQSGSIAWVVFPVVESSPSPSPSPFPSPSSSPSESPSDIPEAVTPTPTPTSSPSLDPSTSTVVLSGAAPVVKAADGVTSAIVTVTLKNSAGGTMSGLAVTLTSSRPDDDTVTQLNPLSDASGSVSFLISSPSEGSSFLSASVPSLGVSLDQAVALTFVEPGEPLLSGVAALPDHFGYAHSCVIMASSQVKCWGTNTYGQLGDGTTTSTDRPVTVLSYAGGPPLTGVTQLSLGTNHTCARLNTGGVKCWGSNSNGELGDGTIIDQLTPATSRGVDGEPVSYAARVSASDSVTFIQYEDGSVIGLSSYSQYLEEVWDGYDWSTAYATIPYSWEVSTPSAVSQLFSRYYRSCGSNSQGAINCWSQGGLALSTPSGVTLGGGRSLDFSDSHTCFLDSSGAPYCWGTNSLGQLGDGTTTNRTTPVSVAGITSLDQISAGESFSCGLLSNGQVKCWGRISNLGVAESTPNSVSTPTLVSGVTDAVAISSGSNHTCALIDDTSLRCWGQNGQTQLRNPIPISSVKNVDVVTAAQSVKAGHWHACAIQNELIYCWGNNTNGQIGDGTTTHRSRPTSVSGISGATHLAVGSQFSCARLSNGSVKCWGLNAAGVAGNQTTPIAVSGLSNATDIFAGGTYACAILSTTGIQCWGTNIPTPPAGLTGVTQLGLSSTHACALLNGGTMTCWGDNSAGQTGGASSITGASAIATGYQASCALISGQAWCWGNYSPASTYFYDDYYDTYGCYYPDGNCQEITIPSTGRASPTAISGFSTASQLISSASGTFCALLPDGSAKCWGTLDPTVTTATSLSEITGTPLTQLAPGGSHKCGLKSNGEVVCFGANTFGQLGRGSTAYKTPIAVLE